MTRPFRVALALALAASAVLIAGGGREALPQALTWEASAGPFTGVARQFAESDSGTLFAWVQGEFFRSRDDGAHWTRCESQPATDRPNDPWMFAVGRRLYAMSDPGRALYVSDDECVTSRPLAAPAGSVGFPETVSSVDGLLFAGYRGHGLFRLDDEGRTWTRLDAPSDIQSPVIGDGGQLHLIAAGRHFGSSDTGTTWVVLGGDGVSMDTEPQRFVAGLARLMRPRDGGLSWAPVRQPPFTLAAAHSRHLNRVATDGIQGIQRSSDDGVTWTSIPSPTDPRYFSSAMHETRTGTLLAATGVGIFRWSGAEAGWRQTGVAGRRLLALAAQRGIAYASFEGTLQRSDDSGLTWSRVEPTFAGTPRPLAWPTTFRRLFPAEDGTLHASTDRQLLSSKDGGRTWTSTGLEHGVHGLLHAAGAWYAATSHGVFQSRDFSEWRECSDGLASADTHTIVAMANGDLIVHAGAALFRSTNGCGTWSRLADHPTLAQAHLSAAKPWPLLVGDPNLGIGLFGRGIAQFAVARREWIAHTAVPQITDWARDANGRYWLGSRSGLYRLETDVSAWRLVDAGLEGPVGAVAIDPAGFILAAVDGRGVFRARLP